MQQRNITTLVKDMSRIAHALSDLVSTVMEQDAAPMPLHEAYRRCCEIKPPAMPVTEFADMVSQLCVYSCFVARYYHNDATEFRRQHLTAILSYAHPLHRECVEAIIAIESGCAPMAASIDEMLRLLAPLDKESIDRSFRDDPLTHCYELLLHHYNPRLRASHGIFYTPQPIVSYMVRSIEQLLRSRFACRAGLGEIEKDIHLLDPACGTGVFVQATLEHTYLAYQQHDREERWRAHLLQYFLPRLTGIEVLMTPYLIAHLRLNLFLAGVNAPSLPDIFLWGAGQVEKPKGARKGPHPAQPHPRLYYDEEAAPQTVLSRGGGGCEDGLGPLRAPFGQGIRPSQKAPGREASTPGSENPLTPFHLGNALSETDNQQGSPASIMIVLGNPPYAGHSANKEAWMLSLLDDYKAGCPELKKRAQAKWLSDDYVKFIRLAQWRIDRAGQGILAFITSHSYLDNPTFRGMRRSLMRSFDELFVLDLHGNSKKQELAPDDSRDENVFAIQPGVAISIFVKHGNPHLSRGEGGEKVGRGPLRSPFSPISPAEVTGHTPIVYHAHLWGSRAEKLAWLSAHDLESTPWTIQHPQAPGYLFAPQETCYLEEYEAGWSIPDIFQPTGDPAPGIITCHDEFAVAWNREEAIDKIERLLATRDEDEARQHYRLCAQEQWSYAAAKRALSDCQWREQLTPLLYRPFDTRWTVYNRHVAVHLRERVTRHLLPGKDQSERQNLALLIGKAGQVISGQAWDIVFCSRLITEFNLFRRGGNNIFPLYLAAPDGQAGRDLNLAPDFIADVASHLELQWIADGQGDLYHTVGPEDIFSYMYALLHAPGYRARYAAFLKHDFPRIPLTSNLTLFRALRGAGEKLVRLHLVEGEIPSITRYPAAGTHRVEQIRYTPRNDEKAVGRVWINAAQYFEDVPAAAWTMRIGGYQVCLKWLKDRRGRTLSRVEITHYQKIVAVLAETSRLMGEIDDVIEQAGGWPL